MLGRGLTVLAMYARNVGVAGAMLLAASCVVSIPLGSECPDLMSRCSGDGAPRASPSSPDAGRGLEPSDADAQAIEARSDVGIDASPARSTPPELRPDAARGFDAAAVESGGNDTGSRDASFADHLDVADAEVAEVDAGDAGILPITPDTPFPALENGSFAITRGVAGPLAYEPIDPLAIGTNLAEPWAACRPGFSVVESANASDGLPAVTVVSSDSTTFVEADLGVIDILDLMGLRQALQTPLRAGERYALRVDVRASLGANATLELWASYVDCVPAIRLASVGAISDSDWRSVCLSFVAPMDIPELILAPSRLSTVDNIAARVFFDNVRPGPDCE